jgi:hypothetical protein
MGLSKKPLSVIDQGSSNSEQLKRVKGGPLCWVDPIGCFPSNYGCTQGIGGELDVSQIEIPS